MTRALGERVGLGAHLSLMALPGWLLYFVHKGVGTRPPCPLPHPTRPIASSLRKQRRKVNRYTASSF